MPLTASVLKTTGRTLPAPAGRGVEVEVEGSSPRRDARQQEQQPESSLGRLLRQHQEIRPALFLPVACMVDGVQAAKVLGAPTTFDAEKLTVQFARQDHHRRPAFPRAYTLSHCDFTANLTLAVSEIITIDQLRRWRPDDVFAEWKQMTSCSGGGGAGEMTLHLHCLVSGRNPLQGLAAGFRYYVFSKELPLVLKAVVHGDGALFADRPELMEAQVWVNFHSASTKYNRIECWGPLREAAERNLLDGRLDELQSEISKRRRKWNIFNALVSLFL